MPSASKVAMPAVPFRSPSGKRTGFGDTEVQRVIEGR